MLTFLFGLAMLTNTIYSEESTCVEENDLLQFIKQTETLTAHQCSVFNGSEQSLLQQKIVYLHCSRLGNPSENQNVFGLVSSVVLGAIIFYLSKTSVEEEEEEDITNGQVEGSVYVGEQGSVEDNSTTPVDESDEKTAECTQSCEVAEKSEAGSTKVSVEVTKADEEETKVADEDTKVAEKDIKYVEVEKMEELEKKYVEMLKMRIIDTPCLGLNRSCSDPVSGGISVFKNTLRFGTCIGERTPDLTPPITPLSFNDNNLPIEDEDSVACPGTPVQDLPDCDPANSRVSSSDQPGSSLCSKDRVNGEALLKSEHLGFEETQVKDTASCENGELPEILEMDSEFYSEKINERKPMVFVGGISANTSPLELVQEFKEQGYNVTVMPRIRYGVSFGFCPDLVLSCDEEVEELLSQGRLKVKDRWIDIRPYIPKDECGQPQPQPEVNQFGPNLFHLPLDQTNQSPPFNGMNTGNFMYMDMNNQPQIMRYDSLPSPFHPMLPMNTPPMHPFDMPIPVMQMPQQLSELPQHPISRGSSTPPSTVTSPTIQHTSSPNPQNVMPMPQPNPIVRYHY